MYEDLMRRLRYERLVTGGSTTKIIEEAVDAIEERNKRIEELEATQEILPETQHFINTKADSIIEGLQNLLISVKGQSWIPVTERLPELRHAVLVYAPYMQNQFMAYWTGNEWRNWGPDDWADRVFPKCHEITHWMPLPEPPKGEVE